jgi:hypothetical protein
MDMNTDRITDLLENESYKSRMHFFEGDITINKEWVEYHVKKCDVILPLVAIATPSTYVKAPLRTGLRSQPADRAFGRQVRQAPGVPVDLGSVWHVRKTRN